MKPNIWTSNPNASQTRLTYGVRVQPSPLTISLNEQSPTLASLEVTITNQTGAPVEVESVTFAITVGLDADCLTTGTANLAAATSDIANWNVNLPGDVTSGRADITLEPRSGGHLPSPASRR